MPSTFLCFSLVWHYVSCASWSGVVAYRMHPLLLVFLFNVSNFWRLCLQCPAFPFSIYCYITLLYSCFITHQGQFTNYCGLVMLKHNIDHGVCPIVLICSASGVQDYAACYMNVSQSASCLCKDVQQAWITCTQLRSDRKAMNCTRILFYVATSSLRTEEGESTSLHSTSTSLINRPLQSYRTVESFLYTS